MRHRRQRRDGEGRHVLPDHRAQAPARTGSGARESPALHLSRRFGRRLPAAAGRRLPRPRTLRPHLLQPGADVGARDPAAGRGDGIVHGRWRVRPGDVRRGDHRARTGHDLPGWSAAGAGRHGRTRRCGDARRWRRARTAVRRRRLPRRQRCARAVDGAAPGGQPQPHGLEATARAGPRTGSMPPKSCTESCRGTRVTPTTCAK